MKYELYEGDCLEKMKDIPDGSVDMILCDLPYGMTQCHWDKLLPFDPLWKEYRRVIKPNGNVLLFGSQPFISDVIHSNRKEFSHSWYWVKNFRTGALNAKKQPMRCVEEIAVFIVNRTKEGSPTYNPQGLVKTKKPRKKSTYPKKIYGSAKQDTYLTHFKNYPSHLLFFDLETASKRYPTQKPVDLLTYLIKTYSNQEEMVLDSCMGSGSTGVACLQTGRNFIGIELNEKTFQTAVDRMYEAKREVDCVDFTYVEYAANAKEDKE